ncbi:hypothetical protein FraQA3DRAFT_2508 [Frankia sp. QA3]|nr:hypothetical protein FraQA3DRAFT_2508 [Frankia sp. QA3]
MSTAFPENVHGVVRLAGAGHGIHDERLNRAAFTKHLLRFLAQYA